MKKNYFYLSVIGISLIYSHAIYATTLWKIYQDALVHDPLYQEAIATHAYTQEEKQEARSYLLPTVSASANDQLNEQQSNSAFNSSHGYTQNYGLTVSQPIINANHWIQKKKSAYDIKAADADLKSAQSDLIIRVATLYFKVLTDNDNLIYLEKEKSAYAQDYYNEQTRYKIGLDVIAALYQAKATYNTAISNTITGKAELNNDIDELRTLTGREYSTIDHINMPQTKSVLLKQPIDFWINEALHKNSALASAHFESLAARENIHISESNHLPTLNLAANYTKNSGPSNLVIANNISTIGLQLNLPIFQGGLINSQTKQAEENFHIADEKLQDTYYQTITSIRQKYNALFLAYNQMDADKTAVDSSEKALAMIQIGYNEKTNTMMDLLNAEESLYQAKTNYLTHEYNLLLNQLLLKQAIGILNESDLKFSSIVTPRSSPRGDSRRKKALG